MAAVETLTLVQQLYNLPGNGKAEIVDGKIMAMSPTGFMPAYAAGEIYASLREYARRTHAGVALGDNVGFLVDLPHRRSFSPDAAFFTGEPTGMKFLQGAPVFALEVRSEGDYGPAAEAAIAAKRRDYFAAGTLVVWDVDLLHEDVVAVYRHDAPDRADCYRRDQMAEAEPALPGWRFAVHDLFAER